MKMKLKAVEVTLH